MENNETGIEPKKTSPEESKLTISQFIKKYPIALIFLVVIIIGIISMFAGRREGNRRMRLGQGIMIRPNENNRMRMQGVMMNNNNRGLQQMMGMRNAAMVVGNGMMPAMMPGNNMMQQQNGMMPAMMAQGNGMMPAMMPGNNMMPAAMMQGMQVTQLGPNKILIHSRKINVNNAMMQAAMMQNNGMMPAAMAQGNGMMPAAMQMRATAIAPDQMIITSQNINPNNGRMQQGNAMMPAMMPGNNMMPAAMMAQGNGMMPGNRMMPAKTQVLITQIAPDKVLIHLQNTNANNRNMQGKGSTIANLPVRQGQTVINPAINHCQGINPAMIPAHCLMHGNNMMPAAMMQGNNMMPVMVAQGNNMMPAAMMQQGNWRMPANNMNPNMVQQGNGTINMNALNRGRQGILMEGNQP